MYQHFFSGKKILEKVNVPNQHAIFRESVENQHVSRVFMDHLYPPKIRFCVLPFDGVKYVK